MTDEKTKYEKIKCFDGYVRLRKSDAGIFLFFCDKDGKEIECGNILQILPNGRLFICNGIDPKVGLPLTDRGRIKFEEEDF